MADELRARFTLRFAGGAAINADLALPLDRAAVTVLFGPSGAGKTTVLRCLAGLERPDTGTIACGSEVWLDAARGICATPQQRRLGFLPQNYALFPHLTVEENVGYGIGARGAAAEPKRRRVAAMMDLCRLAGLERRYPRQLSGGQLQRVALARSLAPEPRLLLLDEPLSALDAPTRSELRGELRALMAASGVPTLLVTHDRTEAISLGDRMAVMLGGAIRQTGPVGDVLRCPADAAVARSLGVETIVPSRVIAANGDGLLTVEAGGARITVVDPGNLDGKEIFVCIRAEDVTLEKAAGGTSARNHLAGRIAAIAQEWPLVRVTLDCGFPLVALVTRPAVEQLELAEGQAIVAAVKATSIHLIPRGGGR